MLTNDVSGVLIFLRRVLDFKQPSLLIVDKFMYKKYWVESPDTAWKQME